MLDKTGSANTSERTAPIQDFYRLFWLGVLTTCWQTERLLASNGWNS